MQAERVALFVQGNLARERALARRAALHLMLQFVHCDRDQQPPQIAAALEHVAAVARADEEAAAGRLHHVLRIDVPGQADGEPTARQGEQALGISAEDFAGGALIAVAPAHHQIGGRVFHRHPVGRGRAMGKELAGERRASLKLRPAPVGFKGSLRESEVWSAAIRRRETDARLGEGNLHGRACPGPSSRIPSESRMREIRPSGSMSGQ